MGGWGIQGCLYAQGDVGRKPHLWASRSSLSQSYFLPKVAPAPRTTPGPVRLLSLSWLHVHTLVSSTSCLQLPSERRSVSCPSRHPLPAASRPPPGSAAPHTALCLFAYRTRCCGLGAVPQGVEMGEGGACLGTNTPVCVKLCIFY